MATKTSKTAKTQVVETKADMIKAFIKKGFTNSEIIKSVKEVYATCYYSEVTRLRTA